MKCREVADFLNAYLGGELPPQKSAVFERHLRACSPCVDYLHTYELTVTLGRKAYDPGDGSHCQIPEELVQAILAAMGVKQGSA